MLELRRLNLLHLFAVHGTIAGAAAASGYSPSAVSQQLAVLEREAGVALFERSARSAALTEAGQRLAAHAATVLTAVEAAEADLARVAGAIAGRVVLGAIPTAATALAPALIRLRRAHTELDLVLRQHGPDEALSALRTREIDIAIVDFWTDDAPTQDGIDRRLLLNDPLVLAGAVTEGLWLSAPTDQPSRAASDTVLAKLGIQPRLRWEFEGLATIAGLVAAGTGAAVLPKLALLGLDVPVKTLNPPRYRRVEAAIRTGSQTRPAIVAILDALQEESRRISRARRTSTPRPAAAKRRARRR
jgi:DNA-binding transcriptional LysR family regulator